MKGIAKLVNEYLKKKLDLTIYNDVFADDKAGATDTICRYDPSAAARMQARTTAERSAKRKLFALFYKQVEDIDRRR